MDAREKLLGIALLITYRGRDYLLTESDLSLTSRAASEPQFRGVDSDPANDNMAGVSRIHVEKRELWLAMAPGTFHVLKFPPGGMVDEILAN